MNLIGDVFNLIFFGPIVNVLVVILKLLEALNIPGALGFSIMILTIIIKFAIWPLSHAQLKSSKRMAELKPHMDQLKLKHKDKQALAQAQMSLYKEHGVNPASGCLPSLVQIPIIIALYQVILALFENNGVDRINGFLYNQAWRLSSPPDPNFFGLNLASKPSDFATVGLLVLLVPLATALLQFIQSKMMAPSPVKQYPSDSPKEKKEKVEVEDTMAAMQSQMMYMMPLMIGFFAYQFQIGLAIYWNTFTVMGIWQQYLVSGWGGLEGWIEKVGLKKK